MATSSSASFLRPQQVLKTIGLRAEQAFVHLGCGAGFWLIPAAKIVGASGKAIGVDVRPDMLSEAENRANREHLGKIVQTVRADLEQDGGSTLPGGSADIVLIANIIHQADSTKLLEEGKRLLKPQHGQLVIVEWDVAASPIGPPPAKRIAQEDMKERAARLNLKAEKTFPASPYHYGIIFSPL